MQKNEYYRIVNTICRIYKRYEKNAALACTNLYKLFCALCYALFFSSIVFITNASCLPPKYSPTPQYSRELFISSNKIQDVLENFSYGQVQATNLRVALNKVRAGHWDDAVKRVSNDPIGYEIILWLQTRWKNTASQQEIKNFYARNQLWPFREDVQINYEKYIPLHRASHDPNIPINPVSSRGMLVKAKELLSYKKKEEAKELIRRAWMSDTISTEDMQYMMKHYKSYINDLYIPKTNELIWDRHPGYARLLLGEIPISYRKLAIARIALIEDQYKIDSYINKVPYNLKSHPSLNYERMLWNIRHNRTQKAIDILLKADTKRKMDFKPNKWSSSRITLARDAFSNNKHELAYKLASRHNLSSGKDYAYLEWFSGWIALRFLQRPHIALSHFTSLFENVHSPISKSRAAYWAGRSRFVYNNRQQEQWFALSAKYYNTYYGQLASKHLYNSVRIPDLPRYSYKTHYQFTETGKIPQKAFRPEILSLVFATIALINADDQYQVTFFIRQIMKHSTDDEIRAFRQLIHMINKPRFSILAAKQYIRLHYTIKDWEDIAYPLPPAYITSRIRNIAEEYSVPLHLVLSVMRQESHMYVHAKSSKGGVGIMQVLPSTALAVTREAGIPFNLKTLHNDPIYNIKIGVYYLSQLMKRFDNSTILALAAYNAGPTRVEHWIKDFYYSNNKSQDISYDDIDWIESIPYYETRNYVQRVVEGSLIYRYLTKDI